VKRDVAASSAIWTGIPVAKRLGRSREIAQDEPALPSKSSPNTRGGRSRARGASRSRGSCGSRKIPSAQFFSGSRAAWVKTELAKACGGSCSTTTTRALTRPTLSDSWDRHDWCARLIGSPPGYADSAGRFLLLNPCAAARIRFCSWCDEVESPKTFYTASLSGGFADGRLTDGRGGFCRILEHRRDHEPATSAPDRILEERPKLFLSADGRDALRDVLLERLREFFRPEFLNRVRRDVAVSVRSRRPAAASWTSSSFRRSLAADRHQTRPRRRANPSSSIAATSRPSAARLSSAHSAAVQDPCHSALSVNFAMHTSFGAGMSGVGTR